MTEIVLLAILLVPVAAGYFLKSNGALAFLSVCGGYVLVNLASADIGNLLQRTNLTNLSGDTTNLILVFGPLLLTLLLARGHSGGQLHKLINLIAAFCAGALAALISAPFFGSSIPANLFDNNVWSNLHKAQSWLISGGAFFSLVSIWFGSKSLKRRK